MVIKNAAAYTWGWHHLLVSDRAWLAKVVYSFLVEGLAITACGPSFCLHWVFSGFSGSHLTHCWNFCYKLGVYPYLIYYRLLCFPSFSSDFSSQQCVTKILYWAILNEIILLCYYLSTTSMFDKLDSFLNKLLSWHFCISLSFKQNKLTRLEF